MKKNEVKVKRRKTPLQSVYYLNKSLPCQRSDDISLWTQFGGFDKLPTLTQNKAEECKILWGRKVTLCDRSNSLQLD